VAVERARDIVALCRAADAHFHACRRGTAAHGDFGGEVVVIQIIVPLSASEELYQVI